MSIQWAFLLASVLLLLPPLPFSADLQKVLLSPRRRTFVTPAAAARVWQNWVDLARATAGAYLLTEGVTADPNVHAAELNELLIEGLILGVALVPQTVRLMRTVKILAPISLCGLTWCWANGARRLRGRASWSLRWPARTWLSIAAMAVALLVAGLVLGLSLRSIESSPHLLRWFCPSYLRKPPGRRAPACSASSAVANEASQRGLLRRSDK